MIVSYQNFPNHHSNLFSKLITNTISRTRVQITLVQSHESLFTSYSIKPKSDCFFTYLQTKLVALIREEVDLMNQLDHPNILRLFGVVQEDAQLNVFVEWMAGGSIARLDKIMYFH